MEGEYPVLEVRSFGAIYDHLYSMSYVHVTN